MPELASQASAKLVWRNGRAALVAPDDAPPMTVETIKKILEGYL